MKRIICILALFVLLCASLSSCSAVEDIINEVFGHTVPPSERPCEGHIESEWTTVKEPTCTEEGVRRTVCTLCGKTLRTEVGYAEHNFEHGFCTVCGEERFSEGLEYTLDEDTGTYVVSGIGECLDTDVVIPELHLGVAVGSLSSNAFSSEDGLTSLTLTRSGFVIEPYALMSCTTLESVRLCDAANVGPYAFSGCTSLAYVNIPKNARLGGGAFKNCSPELRAEFDSAEGWYSGPIGWMGGSALSEAMLSDPKKAGSYLRSTENFIWNKRG